MPVNKAASKEFDLFTTKRSCALRIVNQLRAEHGDLTQLPSQHKGQHSNLIAEHYATVSKEAAPPIGLALFRVWRSRMTVADGAERDCQLEVEMRACPNGSWEHVATFNS